MAEIARRLGRAEATVKAYQPAPTEIDHRNDVDVEAAAEMPGSGDEQVRRDARTETGIRAGAGMGDRDVVVAASVR